jgi:hypothetical protein
MMLSLPPASRREAIWRAAASLLTEAAASNTYSKPVGAETQLKVALKIEGLL